jgi:alkanesulfonate monooxygenase SsuD/methylene tetrahydromethanopterin reductase-like flavin-dependent oxidoreductase (luciferase family)
MPASWVAATGAASDAILRISLRSGDTEHLGRERASYPMAFAWPARAAILPRMKFGVLQFFSWPERRIPIAQVYQRALSRIEIMDRTGYDAVWLAEHHFNSFSVCPSVHLMGTHVAARTQRLRIGTAVTLAAFYHPLRIAEEVALLDVLSGGRVNFGAGRGFDATEFRAFGVPPQESADRFREAVEIVLAAWNNDRLNYDGRYFSFENVEVLPKPIQAPHPPVWVAASSEPAVEWAAQRGLTIMMDPHSPHSEIGRKRELYRTQLEAAGHRMDGREIPMARLVAVAESPAKAEEVARSGAGWIVGSYMGKSGAFFDPKGTQRDPIERYLDGIVVYGTPEKVVDDLQRLGEEMFLDYLLAAPLSHESFLLFTERVLPKLV